jgi:hypothetical protein
LTTGLDGRRRRLVLVEPLGLVAVVRESWQPLLVGQLEPAAFGLGSWQRGLVVLEDWGEEQHAAVAGQGWCVVAVAHHHQKKVVVVREASQIAS